MKKVAALLLVALSPVRLSWAAPSISSVSGNIDHGATLTINGSGFGTHGDYGGSSHSIPDHLATVWKNFEDNTLVSDGLTVENSHSASWLVESNSARTNSTRHGRRFYFAHGDGLERISGLQKTQAGTTGDWFFSYWFWVPALADVNLIDGGKPFRIYGSGAAGNIYLGSIDDSSQMGMFSECTGCSPAPAGAKSRAGGYKLGEWHRIDVAMSESDSQFIVYRNMQKFYCTGSTTAGFTNCSNSYAEQYVDTPFGGNGHTFIYGHMIDGPSSGGDGGYYRMDDLYATYSLAHVEICNQPTWNGLLTGGGTSSIRCEVQIPISWSDSEVQINVNTGAFSAGESAYLYVISNAGTPESFDVNATGFPIEIGSTGTGLSDPTPSDAVLIGYQE